MARTVSALRRQRSPAPRPRAGVLAVQAALLSLAALPLASQAQSTPDAPQRIEITGSAIKRIEGGRFLFAARPLALDPKAAEIIANGGKTHLAALLPRLEALPAWSAEAAEANGDGAKLRLVHDIRGDELQRHGKADRGRESRGGIRVGRHAAARLVDALARGHAIVRALP